MAETKRCRESTLIHTGENRDAVPDPRPSKLTQLYLSNDAWHARGREKAGRQAGEGGREDWTHSQRQGQERDIG